MPFAGGGGLAILGAMDMLTKMTSAADLGLDGLAVAVEQPPDDIETTTVDGVFIKAMIIKRAGTVIPQHSHAWDHASYVSSGAVRIWRDGVLGETVSRYGCIHVKAGVKHTFQALEDDTVVLCIHNLHSADKVAILEEHHLAIEGTCGECEGCKIA